MNHSFGKAYKLCSKKLIDEVFESGVTVKSYPLIAKYKKVELTNDAPFQMVISAPKRTFKNAFQRNRIKRLCKEAIRLNKQILEEPLNNKKLTLGICLIYSAKEELAIELLNRKTQKLFNKIIDDLDENI
ncbi:MAG: ribonuclease P protein component [Crocinitomicaceae bacterium]|nr:ribonuclease P protein component [Crocinitomicaceae bacterium]MDC1196039.1 ribonuclease P protein component [Crocinitomicaceae bacterium]MDC1385650.1 ribonuclease P protein component [Crocinitomicaceae bacterium]|tara:strand:+ start:1511 stop:1900 length:390 start_codon:yes stop_codon:yes gene_type:complete